MIKPLFIISLIVLTGYSWRLGGSVDKLFRRIGSSLCMAIILCTLCSCEFLWFIFSTALIVWGCVSYFGFLNYIVRKFWDEIEMEREYWWNFFAENLIIQSSVLPFRHSIINIFLVIIFAGVGALGKVLIDETNLEERDVVSEWWHGSFNAIGIAINSII